MKKRPSASSAPAAEPGLAQPGPVALPAIIRSGVLAGLEDGAKEMILRTMTPLRLEAGRHAFHAGDSASNFFVVKSGTLRVSVPTDRGRDIRLYRVAAGETCVLTTACLLSGRPYDAEAVAETDTEVIILPKAAFDELMASSARFRQFVFASFGTRLEALIGLVQEVAVKAVDRRLARLLLNRARDGAVSATHQELTEELNSAREVVTRLLDGFAEQGLVELARGHITLRDATALERLGREV